MVKHVKRKRKSNKVKKCITALTEADIKKTTLAIQKKIDKCDHNRKLVLKKKLTKFLKRHEVVEEDDEEEIRKIETLLTFDELKQNDKNINGTRLFPKRNKDSIKFQNGTIMNRMSHVKRCDVRKIKKGERKNIYKKDMDFCGFCNGRRVLRWDIARSVCVQCHASVPFPKHVYESRDAERVTHNRNQHTKLGHLRKHCKQYERNFPLIPVHILEQTSISHFQNGVFGASIQPTTTEKYLNEAKAPSIFRKSSDRVTRSLRADPTPEYSPDELKLILYQRGKLRPDQINNVEKHRKSLNNTFFMRHLGCMNNMRQSTLFQHSRTPRIHHHQIDSFHKQCDKQDTLDDQAKLSWKMHPT
jgi:hypothetical protein